MFEESQPPLPLSVQAKLARGDTKFRPLGSLNSAMRDLNMDAGEVRVLVELGYLVAFNIAVRSGAEQVRETRPVCARGTGPGPYAWVPPGRRRCKSELRILTRSLELYRLLKTKRVCDLEWPQIFRLIVAHERPVVKGTEIQRILNCDRGHVANLVRADQLKALRKSRRGCAGTWGISRESFEQFLKKRLL